jgi:flavin-binding protein dodecin
LNLKALSGAFSCPAHRARSTAATRPAREIDMTVARVTEISSTSPKGFDDAVNEGVARATKTLRNVTGAWVKEQRVDVKDGRIVEYQVNLLVTFILDD